MEPPGSMLRVGGPGTPVHEHRSIGSSLCPLDGRCWSGEDCVDGIKGLGNSSTEFYHLEAAHQQTGCSNTAWDDFEVTHFNDLHNTLRRPTCLVQRYLEP